MKILFLTVFLLISFVTFANTDAIIIINKGNIHFQYSSSSIEMELEIDNKIKILLDLSDKLLKIKGYTNKQINFFFNHDFTNRHSKYIALGYGEFSYWDYEKYSTTIDQFTTGLKLVIRDRDFDIKEVLNLINTSCSNVNFIKFNQKKLIIDEHHTINGIKQFDTLSSISPIQIKNFLSTSDPIIEQLINEKTYRHLQKEGKIGAIDYYYQNNVFHFYKTLEIQEKWSSELGKLVVNKTKEVDILVVSTILQIFGSINDGHIAFINDSVFYYIPQLKDKIGGPFKIDSVRPGRPPIEKYYHDYLPINRFTLFIDKYRHTKAIFFPDSNLVISNFDKLENYFINGLFNQKSDKKSDDDTDLKLYLILSVLGISICLNLWLWKNKHN
ncbi:MAG: hypothetical protein K9H61_12180 [Bacteroidia bacterium]|nr:hypothetical protein [Bacteroidia bacterium]MCF8426718.1 hypothetical protein [Bacteroidia bacterium]MCF8447743.1 hypothetical protein [Bacteroidia bacterium]